MSINPLLPDRPVTYGHPTRNDLEDSYVHPGGRDDDSSRRHLRPVTGNLVSTNGTYYIRTSNLDSDNDS